MTPLAILKYIVDKLQGSPFEPWVDGLLFMLFLVAIWAAISLLLGRNGRKALGEAIAKMVKLAGNRKGYAPEWEARRMRIAPYVDLVGSLYSAFLGLFSAVLVGTAMIVLKASILELSIGLVWVLASVYYTRVQLESASWAHHTIKHRRNPGVVRVESIEANTPTTQPPKRRKRQTVSS